jgi:hypothetical protein
MFLEYGDCFLISQKMCIIVDKEKWLKVFCCYFGKEKYWFFENIKKVWRYYI